MSDVVRAAALVMTIASATLASSASSLAQATRSGNPILPGWYADPEAHVFEGQYWIYPTYSAPYDQQTHMDAFSSTMPAGGLTRALLAMVPLAPRATTPVSV